MNPPAGLVFLNDLAGLSFWLLADLKMVDSDFAIDLEDLSTEEACDVMDGCVFPLHMHKSGK